MKHTYTMKTTEEILLPDQHPAKQGLKQKISPGKTGHTFLPDQHPAKQGLKHKKFKALAFSCAFFQTNIQQNKD